MSDPALSRRTFVRVLASGAALGAMAVLEACTPASTPAPTAAPAKPTTAPAAPAATTAPAAPAATAAPAAATTAPAAAPKPAAPTKPGGVQLPTRVAAGDDQGRPARVRRRVDRPRVHQLPDEPDQVGGRYARPRRRRHRDDLDHVGGAHANGVQRAVAGRQQGAGREPGHQRPGPGRLRHGQAADAHRRQRAARHPVHRHQRRHPAVSGLPQGQDGGPDAVSQRRCDQGISEPRHVPDPDVASHGLQQRHLRRPGAVSVVPVGALGASEPARRREPRAAQERRGIQEAGSAASRARTRTSTAWAPRTTSAWV